MGLPPWRRRRRSPFPKGASHPSNRRGKTPASSEPPVTISTVKIARAPWATGSFVLYVGGLLTLLGAVLWLSVISGDQSSGALAGWSVLFWAVAEFLALWFLMKGRRIAAGLLAVVALGLWAAMVGSFFSWWGWFDNGSSSSPFAGFDIGDLLLELLVLLAALIALRIWRFPLLVLPATFMTWFFVTDLVSGGGNWTTVVSLLMGFVFLAVGLGFDGSDARAYGFWIHLMAGVLIGGAFYTWWHGSDAGWAGLIIVSLIFILVGAGIRRSSYAVLGVLGLIGATLWYTIPETIPFFGSSDGEPTSWAGPVGLLCLGLFLILLGTMLYGRRDDDDAVTAL